MHLLTRDQTQHGNIQYDIPKTSLLKKEKKVYRFTLHKETWHGCVTTPKRSWGWQKPFVDHPWRVMPDSGMYANQGTSESVTCTWMYMYACLQQHLRSHMGKLTKPVLPVSIIFWLNLEHFYRKVVTQLILLFTRHYLTFPTIYVHMYNVCVQ